MWNGQVRSFYRKRELIQVDQSIVFILTGTLFLQTQLAINFVHALVFRQRNSTKMPILFIARSGTFSVPYDSFFQEFGQQGKRRKNRKKVKQI